MQTTSSASELKKSPESSLIRGPFIRLTVVEAKDIFVTEGNHKETGDLYARINYGNTFAGKTE